MDLHHSIDQIRRENGNQKNRNLWPNEWELVWQAKSVIWQSVRKGRGWGRGVRPAPNSHDDFGDFDELADAPGLLKIFNAKKLKLGQKTTLNLNFARGMKFQSSMVELTLNNIWIMNQQLKVSSIV